MTKYVSKCILALEAMLADNTQKAEIIIIESEIGIGKTTLMESLFEKKNKEDVFYFKSGINHVSLDDIYQQLLFFNLTDIYDERTENVAFATFLLKNLIDYALSKVKYICFDGLGLYSNEAASFFFDFVSGIINRQSEKKEALVIFVLVDGEINNKTRGLMRNIGRYVQYFKMPLWNETELEDLLRTNYCNINITNESIAILSKYSFGNAGIFLSNLDYLKIKNVLCKKDGVWNCKSFSEDILMGSFQSNISERFDLLDDALKDVLKKAAIVGMEFSFSVLERPLYVQLASKALNEIENVSRLINEKVDEHNVYEFKSAETRSSIESLVEPENAQSWSNLLGDYYISRIIEDSYSQDVLSLCASLLRAALYYKKSRQHEKSLACCMHLVPHLISQFRFHQALDVIKTAESITITNGLIKSELSLLKYISSVGVFDFDEAFSAISLYAFSVKPASFEEIHINALRAYTLYNKGLTRKAYVIASKNYSLLTNSPVFASAHIGELSLFEKKVIINSTSILAALEKTLGISSYVEHFNFAVNFAKQHNLDDEYYALLRRCSMVHKDMSAVSLLCEAKEYFACRNQIEYAMSCYNLGCEYSYLNMAKEAEENLNIAHGILTTLNHAGIVLIQFEKALVESLFYGNHDVAYRLMKDRCIKYDEDFVELVYNFNMTTFSRKLGLINESRVYLSKTEEINNKNENKLPYFEKLIFAQWGYLSIAEGDDEKAATYFEKFISHEYETKHESVLASSVAYSYMNISAKATASLAMLKAFENKNPVAKMLHENQLIFAELSFWEL